jgi:hypothetical protein
MDYLKACHNVGTFKHKARVTALETMAIQKQKTAKCFNCGKPGHMKNNTNCQHKIIIITNLVTLPFLGYAQNVKKDNIGPKNVAQNWIEKVISYQ